MTPELKLLAINAIFLGYAYFWAYPRIKEKTAIAIVWRDGVIMCAALLTGALFFAGSGIAFSFKVISTNWLIFQIVTYAIMQTPLFAWFAYKHRDTL